MKKIYIFAYVALFGVTSLILSRSYEDFESNRNRYAEIKELSSCQDEMNAIYANIMEKSTNGLNKEENQVARDANTISLQITKKLRIKEYNSDLISQASAIKKRYDDILLNTERNKEQYDSLHDQLTKIYSHIQEKSLHVTQEEAEISKDAHMLSLQLTKDKRNNTFNQDSMLKAQNIIKQYNIVENRPKKASTYSYCALAGTITGMVLLSNRK